MMIKRNIDWPEKLTEVVREYRSREFIYAKSDCCCFVTDCIKAMTGWNFMHGFKMRYKTERGALGELARCAKVKTVEELAATRLGEEVSILKAQRGDVVSASNDGMQALGIVVGRVALFMHVDLGLIEVNVENCYKAWRV